MVLGVFTGRQKLNPGYKYVSDIAKLEAMTLATREGKEVELTK